MNDLAANYAITIGVLFWGVSNVTKSIMISTSNY